MYLLVSHQTGAKTLLFQEVHVDAEIVGIIMLGRAEGLHDVFIVINRVTLGEIAHS